MLKKLSLLLNREFFFINSLLIITCIFFSCLIPPFQSPDEHDHIKRSYLLSRGVIILDHFEGQSSGGMVDSGLLDYMNAYPKKLDKLSLKSFHNAADIHWSGIKVYSPAPGTGYYFPLIYLPQTIGLAIGEQLGLTIESSYQLARLFALITVATLIFIAFSIYPTNPLIIGFLSIPMSIFQFSSASLDGVSTALTIFTISVFLKIARNIGEVNNYLFYSFTFSVILLATSRTHLLPLLALVLYLCLLSKRKKYYFIFSLSVMSVLFWMVIAIKTTVDLRVILTASPLTIALYYLEHPMTLFNILKSTLTDKHLIATYYKSFIGILGWFDINFTLRDYHFILAMLGITGVFSISLKNIKIDWMPRLLLIVVSISSILLTFIALLVTWTPHPAKLIDGVQGRYFFGSFVMFAYAISGDLNLCDGKRRKIALILVSAIFAFTIIATTKLLIERYYIGL